MSQVGLIDGLQFARGAGAVKGTLGPSDLRRLAEMRCATQGLSYELSGRADADGRCWLSVSASGVLGLACQRCLGPLAFTLSVHSELLLATSEREIALADDDIDRVLARKDMEVVELVEDEVLLALPMAPMHDRCGGVRDSADSGRPSQFAALAKLKRMN